MLRGANWRYSRAFFRVGKARIPPLRSSSYITKFSSSNLSPAVVEAASTVIFAAPQVDSKGIRFCNTPLGLYLTFSISDLLTCRELLGVRLGPHFLHTASTNKDHYVSAQVCKNYNLRATCWLTASLHRRLFEHCPRLLSQPRTCTRTLRASRAHIMFNGSQNFGRVMCESFQQDVATFLTLYQPRRPFRDPR